MFSDPGELVESDAAVEFVSVAGVWLVADCFPDCEDGDSVGFFCESNSIGPRTLGLSVCFSVVSSFVSGVVGLTFGSGTDGVVSG